MLMRRRLLAIGKRVRICRRGHDDPRGSCLGTENLFTTRAQVGDTFMIDHRYTVSTTITMHRDGPIYEIGIEKSTLSVKEVGMKREGDDRASYVAVFLGAAPRSR